MELDLAYLQTELARIDVLLQREFWRWQHAGRNPAETFQGLYVSEVEAEALLTQPFGTNWSHLATLQPNKQFGQGLFFRPEISWR